MMVAHLGGCFLALLLQGVWTLFATRAFTSKTTVASALPGMIRHEDDRVELELGASYRVKIFKGDITSWEGDAIVNAANERMLGGGGVDGAIHRAAGPDLYEACKEVPLVSRNVRCPTGEARITPGFRLPARHVIHTVGPIYSDEEKSAPYLYNAYRNSLKLASEHQLKTVAFPAISCGVYGYPLRKAARVALKACYDQAKEEANTVEEVDFVLFSSDVIDAWIREAEGLVKSLKEEEEKGGGGANGGEGDGGGSTAAEGEGSEPKAMETEEGEGEAGNQQAQAEVEMGQVEGGKEVEGACLAEEKTEGKEEEASGGGAAGDDDTALGKRPREEDSG